MTLDEAIKHCDEVADTCESEAKSWDMTDAYESNVACGMGKCADEHRQLSIWLRELKVYRQILPSVHDYLSASEMPQAEGENG